MPLFGSLLLLGFTMYCVLDVVLTDPVSMRNLPKLMWLVLVLLVPVIGGITWLVAGRPRAGGPEPGGQVSRRRPTGRDPWPRGRPDLPPRRPAPPAAPRGPDDDPAFLRDLDERLRRRDDG